MIILQLCRYFQLQVSSTGRPAYLSQTVDSTWMWDVCFHTHLMRHTTQSPSETPPTAVHITAQGSSCWSLNFNICRLAINLSHTERHTFQQMDSFVHVCALSVQEIFGHLSLKNHIDEPTLGLHHTNAPQNYPCLHEQ